mmetsp:Transcript_25570/g.45346  ORF Transcript_25570/g.45346 Transcript_25570/m.45346 type:complete len:178 (-) Transcript_25570:178-711(-)
MSQLQMPWHRHSRRSHGRAKRAVCELRVDGTVPGTLGLIKLKACGGRGSEGRRTLEVRYHIAPGPLAQNTLHGFHIHETADFSTGCASAGGHYNPFDSNHGNSQDQPRHVGDFGNIRADSSGLAEGTITAPVALDSVIGRAFVLHLGEDDLGQGGDAGSITTGNAGARLACCKIVAV